MQSRFLVCVALAGFALANGRSLVAHAADPKAKSGKKKDDASEDKTGIGKTLSWEEKVMGPDDKKSELDKIKQAQAINKAAQEKAERDKVANAAREAKEKEAAAKAGPTTTKRGGDVALPTLPDEGPGAGKSKPQHTEISPKLDTAEAAKPAPVLKPADDKFIDKLLKEESGPRKKKGSSDDKALIDMLASEKPGKAASTGKKGRKDGVDDLLTEAEKAAPMPETKVKHETPEWAKPEIRERAPTPVVAAPPPPKEKHNDGIIRVVQGAAGSSSSSGSAKPAVVTTTTRVPPPPPGAGVRKQTAAVNSRPGEWADPFSDPSPRKGGKVAASKRQVVEEEDLRPATRRASAPPPPSSKREASRSAGGGDWADPFSDTDRKSSGTRRGAAPSSKPAKADPPARGAGWKDPFTSDTPAAKPGRAVVASREPAAKKAVAAPPAHRAVAAASPDNGSAGGKAQGRWGVLKKRH